MAWVHLGAHGGDVNAAYLAGKRALTAMTERIRPSRTPNLPLGKVGGALLGWHAAPRCGHPFLPFLGGHGVGAPAASRQPCRARAILPAGTVLVGLRVLGFGPPLADNVTTHQRTLLL